MPAEREVSVDAGFEGRPAPLLEPRYLRLDERLVGQVGERRPAPHREGLAEHLGGRIRVGFRQVARLLDQVLEAIHVELTGMDVQSIRAPLRLEPSISSQRLAQRRNLVVQHLLSASRRILSPKLLDKTLAGDQFVGPEHEQGQEGALASCADRESEIIVADDL